MNDLTMLGRVHYVEHPQIDGPSFSRRITTSDFRARNTESVANALMALGVEELENLNARLAGATDLELAQGADFMRHLIR